MALALIMLKNALVLEGPGVSSSAARPLLTEPRGDLRVSSNDSVLESPGESGCSEDVAIFSDFSS